MSERRKKILIVDDDPGVKFTTRYMLRDKYECLTASHGDEAKAIIQEQPVDIILLDIHMRTHEEGLEYLPLLKTIDPDVDVIIVSTNTEIDLASRAIRNGASAYLVKDHSVDQLIITIESVLNKRELIRDNQHYVRDRKRILEKNQIIGESEAIRRLMGDIEKIRRSSANVIITAETGCGKELVARHIGAVDGRPFIAVDSATITSSMAESILFGHEKGAFTGATSRSKGLFEEADGGTIYFDEISNMPLEIQSKLLRVIQEKEITRLGSSRSIPLEFRVICATNKNLESLGDEGKFKHDLYQRLNVIPLELTPLRERTDDIPLLVNHFLDKARCETSARGFSRSAMELLTKYHWPGNVRELSNLIANLCTMVVDKDLIDADDLPLKIRGNPRRPALKSEAARSDFHPSLNEAFEDPAMDFYKYMHSIEGRVLTELYQMHQGNISKMSKSLKMSRSHLYSKLSAHRISD